MSKLGPQLRELRENKGLTQQDLRRATGIEQATISRIERGEVPLVSPHLAPLAQALGLQVINPLGENSEPVALQGTIIPVWPQSETARIFTAPENEREQATHSHTMSYRHHSIRTLGMLLEDDSMEPRFRRGNVIIADPELEIVAGKFVVARRGNEPGAILRQFADRGQDEHGNRLFELLPLNPVYPVLHSQRNALEILGVACELQVVDL